MMECEIAGQAWLNYFEKIKREPTTKETGSSKETEEQQKISA